MPNITASIAYWSLNRQALNTITLHSCKCGRYHVWQFEDGCPDGEPGYLSAQEYESRHDVAGYRIVTD